MIVYNLEKAETMRFKLIENIDKMLRQHKRQEMYFRVHVFKDGEEVAICENAREAAEATGTSADNISKFLKGVDSKGRKITDVNGFTFDKVYYRKE